MTEPTLKPQTDPTPQLISYASPTPLASEGDVLNEAGTLVVRNHHTLPEVCCLCGKAGERPTIHVQFSWDPSFHVIRSADSTLKVRQRGDVRIFLCRFHQSRYARNRLMGLIGIFGGALLMVLCMVIAIVSESSDVPRLVPPALVGMFAGFAFFVVFAFVYTVGTRTLGCAKIEGDYLWLTGVHPRVLEDLPRIGHAGSGRPRR